MVNCERNHSPLACIVYNLGQTERKMRLKDERKGKKEREGDKMRPVTAVICLEIGRNAEDNGGCFITDIFLIFVIAGRNRGAK